MKTIALALAAAATLAAGSAIAAERSSDGNGHLYGFNPNPQTLLGGQAGGLDFEPTASIGGVSTGPVIVRGTEFIGGREANVVYSIENGVETLISKSYRSSDR